MMKKILLLMAHPDDAEIWSGGLIINYINIGYEVMVIYLVDAPKIRKKEAIKVANFLGYKALFHDPHDLKSLIKIISNFGPEIVITHNEQDYHRHHNEVFQIFWQIIDQIVIFNQIKLRWFCCDSHNNFSRNNGFFVPSDYIDISEAWTKKIEAIKMYKSQPADLWLKLVELNNGSYGFKTGVRYAEGYKELPVMGLLNRSKKLL